MKNVLGHMSRSREEVIRLFKKNGHYTMCSLPHYRYGREKGVCYDLASRGLIKKTGEDNTCINWVITDKFKQWMNEGGEFEVLKWDKLMQKYGDLV